MLFKDAIPEFLDYLIVELNRSPATRTGYQKDLNVFLRFLASTGQENITLKEFTPDLLNAYVHFLIKEKNSQPNTIRRHVITLKSFSSFLVDSEYLDQNPAADLQRPRMPQKLPRYLQKGEVDKLISIVPNNGSPSMLRDKTVLMCLYYTGVRAEEVVNIHTVDISIERGFVKIIKGKGSRYRKVPLHQKLTEQLQLYFEKAPELSNGYLFCNKQGGPISTDYVHYMVEEYAKKAGLNKTVTPHMLRHSFATHLYRKGKDLFVIGMLMGHAEMRSTSRYTHTDLQHMRDAVIKLDIPKALEIKISKMEGSIDEP